MVDILITVKLTDIEDTVEGVFNHPESYLNMAASNMNNIISFQVAESKD